MHQVLLRSTRAAQSRVGQLAPTSHLAAPHSRRKSQPATAFDVIARRTLRKFRHARSCAFQPQALAAVPPLASICHSPRCSSCPPFHRIAPPLCSAGTLPAALAWLCWARRERKGWLISIAGRSGHQREDRLYSSSPATLALCAMDCANKYARVQIHAARLECSDPGQDGWDAALLGFTGRGYEAQSGETKKRCCPQPQT